MKQPKNRQEAEKLIGQKAKVISSAGGHGIPKDTIVTITRIGWGNPCYFYNDYDTSVLKPSNIEVIPLTLENLKNLKKELTKKYKEELELIDAKINFLKETKGEEYDVNEFKVYQTLNILENTDNKAEKAKLIAKLINE